MTRDEWYDHWQFIRVKRPKLAPKAINQALKDHYSFSLNDRDQAKLDLISRYQLQVSSRLLAEQKRLLVLGQEQGKKMLKDLYYRDNPFLKMIPKESYQGKYIPVPLEK